MICCATSHQLHQPCRRIGLHRDTSALSPSESSGRSVAKKAVPELQKALEDRDIKMITNTILRSKFSRGGEGGGGGLERQISKDESTRGSGEILTPLKCREMHLKLINEILKCKLSGLKSDIFTQ